MTESSLWRVASRSVLLAISVLLGLYLLYLLRGVMVQLLMAVIISAGMAPIVDRLAPAIDPQPGGARRRRQAPRALVVVLLYALLLGLIGLIGALIIPPAVQQIQELAANLDDYVAGFSAWVNGLPERYPFIPPGLGEGLPSQLQFGAAQVQQILGQAVVVLRFLGGFLGGALNFVFILFLALYITSDSDRIRRYMVRFLAPERRPQAEEVLGSMGERLGGWVRGQIALSAIIGAITLAGLLAIGVPYAVLLSLVAAVGEAVPMVGPIFSAVPAVIVAFFDSPVKGIATLILYIVVQQVENAVVVPKVMERAVSLHPLAVMMALLIGGELYGVPGAILSVPVAAAISVVLNEVLRERDARRADRAGAPGPAGTPGAGEAAVAPVGALASGSSGEPAAARMGGPAVTVTRAASPPATGTRSGISAPGE